MEAQARPRLTIEPTQADKNMEILAVAILLLLWLLAAFKYAALPDTIPMHFNLKGEADGFGNKATIWLLPVVATAIYFLLTFINRYPHQFNYLVQITETNAQKQYTFATKLLRTLKLVALTVFLVLEYLTLQAASTSEQKLPTWFLPVALLLVFLPLIYYFSKSFKKQAA